MSTHSSAGKPYASLGPGAAVGSAVWFGLVVMLLVGLTYVIEFIIRFVWNIIKHYTGWGSPKTLPVETTSTVFDPDSLPSGEWLTYMRVSGQFSGDVLHEYEARKVWEARMSDIEKLRKAGIPEEELTRWTP